ncbi:MAG: helix-turn-helix transcriptional regulator [Verrucomicrobiota bacterium]
MKKSIHTEHYSLFCQLLKEARIHNKLTQADLAKCLKRPQSFVAKIENGERRIDVVEFITVAGAIGISPTSFIKNFENQSSKL